MGHTFWLIYSEKAEQIQARTLVKTIEEAQKLVERLQQQGIKAKIYTWLDSGNYYYVVQLNGTNIARAAQLYPELRPALKELIQKHGISPRGPVTRRLLELADNPPLLA
jgi:two-component SAPR family response regulator